MSWNNIENKALEWLAMLDKHLGLMSRLPVARSIGNCVESDKFYKVESMKVNGKPIEVKFTICKSPIKIIIKYRVPSPKWTDIFLYKDLKPIVIPFDVRLKEGIIKIDSSSTSKVSLGLFRVGLAKVTIKINGMLRWDCANIRSKKSYKLRVRVEYKVKELPCFCYRCRKCKDLVNVEGVIGGGSSENCS